MSGGLLFDRSMIDPLVILSRTAQAEDTDNLVPVRVFSPSSTMLEPSMDRSLDFRSECKFEMISLHASPHSWKVRLCVSISFR